jgi:SAM-dependent methyltransferase
VNELFSEINENKADFESIYTQPDPRQYFTVLGGLDYMIPDLAAPVMRQLMGARSALRGDGPTMLDVGCSYGVNAAVNRRPLSFADLHRRYARREMMPLTSDQLRVLDRMYLAGWPAMDASRWLGLDISAPALDYARAVGLIDQGVVADLEAGVLTDDQHALVSQADMILSTGAVGYVTETTLGQLVDAAADRKPWVVSFVLRMFPYDRIVEAMAARGLVTEKLAGATFVQRRFRDTGEFEQTLAALTNMELDVTGLEADGLLHAELYVSRPEADIRVAPLDEVVTVASGRGRGVSPRYVLVETDEGPQVGVER